LAIFFTFHFERARAGLEFPTVEFELVNIQAVLEFVELDRLAVTKHNSEMFSA
jgi:hypothetical protein